MVIVDLSKLRDAVGKELYGITTREAWERGICIKCKEPALPKCSTEAGIREYRVSAFCEACFDKSFGGDA